MINDVLGGVPPPQIIDIKLEKNSERQETRAVEESSKSDDLQLDIYKENIIQKQTIKDYLNDGNDRETYDIRGNLTQKRSPNNDTHTRKEALNLVI